MPLISNRSSVANLTRRANHFGLPESCQAPKSKIFRFTVILICGIHPPSPSHREGRFAIVTERGAGCDGPLAGVRCLMHQTKRWQRPAKSCGPGAATLASIPPPCGGVATVTKKGRSPGRARISRQTIARGKPGCLGCTCQIRVRS